MSDLLDWERPHYMADGGLPLLFYVIYGEIDPTAPLSRNIYHTNGLPDGIDLFYYAPDKHPEVPGSFRQDYPWEVFVDEHPELAERVRRCDQCMILRGSPADDTSLNYLRDCLGLLAYLLDQGGLAIYDPLTIHWWDPETWRQQLSPVSYDGARHHTVILASEEPDDDSLTWFHTRGMRKFGRPDISIQRVPAVWREGAIDLCQRLIEYQALGHVVSDGEEIRMASLPAGTVVQLAGRLDDPDFNNVHLEVVLPETD